METMARRGQATMTLCVPFWLRQPEGACPLPPVGLPGFQFIQDPVEYETRSHHSNMDVYDRIQPPQISAGSESFILGKRSWSS